MGGKKDDTPQPPAMMPMPDQSENNAMMQQMMAMMGGMMGNMPQAPQLPQTPQIQREPVTNWADKNKQLLAKSKADYNVDKARRKGRTSTILTSPLADDTDTTTSSLVAED